MIKENLVWGKASGTEEKQCANCSRVDACDGWWVSIIHPFMIKENTYSVYICSDQCKDIFLSHPMADQHILKGIGEASLDPESGGVNQHYSKLFERHNKKYPE